MVGTFDLENLGDLLFPSVAHHELAARLGDVELELFSYRAVDPPAWPLKVRPVHTLAARLGEFDLLLVGGGHLVRGDEALAPGYEPTDATTSHPYGLWLTPTLLALGAGVPVAWNAIGTIESVPAVLDPLVAVAVDGVDYLAVRDLSAARFVRARGTTASPLVVPDTVYGVGPLLDGDVADEATRVLEGIGVTGPYVVVQPSGLLEPYARGVNDVAAAAVDAGYAVVELACGPCHLDAAGRLALRTTTVSPGTWPAPLVAAALLQGAEAVVASSLHAGIIATAAGVPLVRPRAESGSKHEQLDVLPGVTTLHEDGHDLELTVRFGRTPPSSAVVSHLAVLAHHWDEVAALASRTAPRSPSPSVSELVERLPGQLLDHEREAADARAATEALVRATSMAHDADLVRDAAAIAELRAALDTERVHAARLEEMLDRRSVRAALSIADTLGALRLGPGISRRLRARDR